MTYGADRYPATVAAITSAKPATVAAIVGAFGPADLPCATACQLQGLGATAAQARRLVAAASLGALSLGCSDAFAPHVRAPDDVARAVRSMATARGWGDPATEGVESFLVLALDARQRVRDIFRVAQGSLSQVDVHPREVFAPLVRGRYHSAILVHNHPSGDASPSDADVSLTRRMATAGKSLGIPVLDHIVIARGGEVCSLAALGMVAAA